ncbi:MAG TPA: class I SAM-dependent methyltransferase [Stellaceae bacterium]|nr:class I SAM-dependent methyltransferase [Stellaceae bacterium]
MSAPPPTHWNSLYGTKDRLGPPLRPHATVIAAYKEILARHDERILLLGVTPGLADTGAELVAVDRSEVALSRVWPGDTERRRATKGDWLALEFPPAHFSAAVGDGSLNSIAYPGAYAALFAQLARVLRPGAVFVTRVYAAPETPESAAEVMDHARAGRIKVFNAFKWRFAMALTAAAGDPNIEVRFIRDGFDRACPDRAALAASAGWDTEDIATIDVYKDSRVIYSFPTIAQARASVPPAFGDIRIVAVGGYELAERCPLMAMTRGQ